MNCPDAEVLIHALIDGELDASHARDVEAHLATCADCSKKLADLRTMHQSMAAAALKESAPAHYAGASRRRCRRLRRAHPPPPRRRGSIRGA